MNSVLLFLAFVSLSFSKDVDSNVDSSCTSFETNGQASNTFTHYRLYDFRDIKGSKSTSNPNSDTVKIVTDSSWKDDWYIRDYPRKAAAAPAIPVDFIPGRVNIKNSTDKSKSYKTYLELATARIDDKTQEAGEITYKEYNVSYASIRVLGRVNGSPGACAGIFTYLNDTQESDIEMFTRAPDDYIQYTNNPSDTGDPDYTTIIGATSNVTTQHKVSWHDWHVHRLDWTPGRTTVFVDDNQRNTSTLQVPVADPPSGLYLDMWGSNSSWVGSMPIGGSATFDVQWVELLFNLTPADSSKVTTTGTPKVCTVEKETSMGVSWRAVDVRSVVLWSVLLSIALVF